jgi:hypothetical protein
MDIIGVLTGLVRGHNMYIEESLEKNTGTELANDDKDLACERQIIQCQLKNGRLLGSTAKALRIKYANMKMTQYIPSYPTNKSDIVDRAIARLKQRRRRGHCSVKAEQEQLTKILKPIIDHFFEKKQDNDYGSRL